MNIVSRPAASINELTDKIYNLAHLYEENERLRRENKQLLAWQQAARNLSHENARLRDLASYTSPPTVHLVTSRVIADMGGPYAHNVMISAGSRDGVSKGQAVLSDEGLGRQDRRSRISGITGSSDHGYQLSCSGHD